MGGSIFYPHSVVQLPSFSAFRTTSRFGIPAFSIKELADRRLVSSIRADGNRDRPKKNTSSTSGRAPKAEGPEDNPRSFDNGSSNKEEILALFKRIQSSISKGETVTSKKRNPKATEDRPSPSPSAESILEVLHQSRTRGKGKPVGKNRDKFVAPQKDSWKREDREEHVSTTGLSTKRPPSNFKRRSPIPTLSNLEGKSQSEMETLQATPTPSPPHPRDEVELESEALPAAYDDSDQIKLEGMKLAQLKEMAKSKGIKGYSKLKKSELVELLIRSP